MNKDKLFAKYKLNFHTLSSYITATYNPMVMKTLSFDAVRDSLSDGQTASKLWVVDTMREVPNIKTMKVGIFGGWVGILGKFIQDFVGVAAIDNIEIDGTLELVNNLVMGNSTCFKFIHSDMYHFDYSSNQYDVYINTSGEHIPSLKKWIEQIPSGKIVIIQSNDYFDCIQHINCVTSAQQLELKVLESNNIKSIIYCGTLDLPIYHRFMVMAYT